MDWATNVLFATVTLTMWIFIDYKRKYSYWRSRGVKGPTPWPFFGTSWPLFVRPITEVDMERQRKYGGVYGTFDGRRPVLVVSDPRVLQDICSKRFHDFQGSFDVIGSDPLDTNMLFMLKGDDYRRVRGVMSSCLTGSKMRTMVEVMQSCQEPFVGRLEQFAMSKGDVHLKELLSLHILDVILKCFFSLDLDLYQRPNYELIKSADAFLGNMMDHKMLFIFSNVHSTLWPLLGAKFSPAESTDYIKVLINELIEVRANEGDEKRPKNDLLEAMIGAKGSKGSNGLKDIEVLANCIGFIAATYDTTVVALSTFIWRMSLHGDVQEKVFQEVQDTLGSDLDKKVTLEQLQDMVYLEAAINETLRINPAGVRGRRLVTVDTTIPGTDIPIDKGLAIVIPTSVVHMDPENFVEPEQFKPERFLPENKATIKNCSYLAFGAGPRMCLGMRFAHFLMKTTAAQLIRRYRVIRSPRTLTKLVLAPSRLMADASHVVQLEKR